MKIIRQSSNKGFVLIEFLMVLFVITLMLPLSIREVVANKDIGNTIILNQLDAMANRKTVLIDTEICHFSNCWFNPRGNINKAKTLKIEQRGVKYELVIWLGFGRYKITKRLSDD